MKKILFAVLAIVFPAIVMAQCPVPTSVTATVTFKRNNVTPALDGVFTIASGTTVKFSRGNLQYKASTDTWQFAAHQYDIIGADNASISSSYDGWIDLFGWATGGNPASGTHYQPWDASTDNTYGNTAAPDYGDVLPLSSDWGRNMGAGWRTLTNDEWIYLLTTRSTAATIEGVSNARYVLATIKTDGSGTEGIDYNIRGLIIFPDNYNQGTPVGVSWSSSSINTNNSIFDGTCATCTTEGWGALEDDGCVFLPCAGQRDGTTVSYVGTSGYYWSATASISTYGRALDIPCGNNYTLIYTRHLGQSVRLVKEVE